MKISYSQMDLLDHFFYYITLLQLLSSPVILLSLILTFTFEQSKGIVLYSQRNCGQESGMCIGIPLPMFLISIVIHISLAKCYTTYFILADLHALLWSWCPGSLIILILVHCMIVLCEHYFFYYSKLHLKFTRLMCNLNKHYFTKKFISWFRNWYGFFKLCNNRRSVDTFRDYKYLGTRVRVDGTVGE
jgi:hypothetical protein